MDYNQAWKEIESSCFHCGFRVKLWCMIEPYHVFQYYLSNFNCQCVSNIKQCYHNFFFLFLTTNINSFLCFNFKSLEPHWFVLLSVGWKLIKEVLLGHSLYVNVIFFNSFPYLLYVIACVLLDLISHLYMHLCTYDFYKKNK